MAPLRPDETEVVGGTAHENGKPVPDAGWLRINWLTSHALKLLGSDESGWLHLYLDPRDGRHWEESRSLGHIHGGGPPMLHCLREEEVKARYPRLFDSPGGVIGR